MPAIRRRPPETSLTDAVRSELGDPLALAELFDSLPRIYFFMKDRVHRFVRLNRGTLLLHGCSSESEMIGKTDADFHPPALAAQYIEEDRLVMSSGRPLRDKVWLVRGADGLPRWYLSTKMPLFGKLGEVVGLAGVMRPYDSVGSAHGEYRRLAPAIEFVVEHYAERITVVDIARRVHLSASQFQREFRRLFGMSAGEHLLQVRLLMARRKLEQETTLSIGTIALDCGFYDQSHFTRAFRARTGITPVEYRKRFTP